MPTSLLAITIVYLANIEAQIYTEEVTENDITINWPQSQPANNVVSDPLCYSNDYNITRNCKNTSLIPQVQYYDPLTCPPSFNRIPNNNSEYCYQISGSSSWKYPCFKSSGACLITDLSDEDLFSLLDSLKTKNISKFFWLPARRVKIFNPVRWYIPGPKWGLQVKTNNSLRIQASPLKNCLLLNIDEKLIVTESCSKKYPSLCFYINEMHYPATCPEKYYAFRFMPEDGVCFGIEQSDTPLTFDEFLSNKCSLPMGQESNNDLSRFIFRKIAELNQLPNNVWCWFTHTKNIMYDAHELQYPKCAPSQVGINNVGTLSLFNSSSLTKLSCMACIVEMVYGNTDFVFEYDAEERLMYLTVYSSSGLWTNDNNNRGIQCFSNARGFVSVIDVNELHFNKVKSVENDSEIIEKKIYTINLITDRSAQYWCEGHSKKFSLISTEKIVVNPQGNKEHVFSLVINFFIPNSDIDNLDYIMEDFCRNITSIFGAKKVLIMDILEYTMDNLLILFHLHVAVIKKYKDDSRNIVSTYENLKTIAKYDLMKYNYTFVNMSSALFCLPTTSNNDLAILDWEMTYIGHIVAPTQFCLQANGLPVKRLCSGSYLLGSVWGDVEGSCDKNYVPSRTTTFLYNFFKGQVSEYNITKFLTVGLSSVLNNVDIFIPADIYYLSMSLKNVLSTVQVNHTSLDLSNIDNMAWVMDRILSLDNSYLRLAQTLNSTNVILDSINNIIELLLLNNMSMHHGFQKDCKILAVQPQFVIQISYPKLNNISGIAITNNKSAKNFKDMEIRALYRNSTLDEVLTMEHLEIAAWLPDNVLNSLIKKTNKTDNVTLDDENVNIVITVFHNDAIFQELEKNKHQVNSRLIGISIPGFILNFDNFVPLVFKDLRQSKSDKICGYWNFNVHNEENMPGSWNRRGCFLSKAINNMTICKCYHLTHFSHLLNIHNLKNGKHINEKHTRALNIITLIGSFLSLLGIACIWITACVFQTWRKKAGTKVLLHFSVSIALPLTLLILFNLDIDIFGEQDGGFAINDNMKTICIILGALLHYSILASFMWMLITAVLQFIRFVKVLGVRRPYRLMLRLTIIGWGPPIIPVLVTLHISKDSYIPDVSHCYKCSICYPKGMFLIFSVVMPVCLILFINIALFIVVLWSVTKGIDVKFRNTSCNIIRSQLKLSIFLFFLLGLTWIFGFFSFSNQLIWSYLFCFTSSLQGFVLFIYFILCNPNTRTLWVTLLKSQYRPRPSRQSISSISSS